jgi:hypothetical protein
LGQPEGSLLHSFVPALNQLNPVNAFPSTSRICKWCLYFRFPNQNPVCITLISGEEYKPRNFSLGSFLHHTITSSFFVRNIFLSTPFLNTISLRSSPNLTEFHADIKQPNYSSVYLKLPYNLIINRP